MTTTPTRYTFGTTLSLPLAVSRERVVDALRAEGFGVITEIDIEATVKAKLGIERDPYLILGACNPSLAHRAIAIDPSLGALLPCNVVLRSVANGTRVEIMDPAAVLGIADAPGLDEIGADARRRLVRVVAALESSPSAS